MRSSRRRRRSHSDCNLTGYASGNTRCLRRHTANPTPNNPAARRARELGSGTVGVITSSEVVRSAFEPSVQELGSWHNSQVGEDSVVPSCVACQIVAGTQPAETSGSPANRLDVKPNVPVLPVLIEISGQRLGNLRAGLPSHGAHASAPTGQVPAWISARTVARYRA